MPEPCLLPYVPHLDREDYLTVPGLRDPTLDQISPASGTVPRGSRSLAMANAVQ